MRCRVAHTASIDGIEPGRVGDFNPDAVRGLLKAGKLVPVEGAGYGLVMPDELRLAAAWSERDAAHARELSERDARITELEVEIAQLKLDLEAATAPSKKIEG